MNTKFRNLKEIQKRAAARPYTKVSDEDVEEMVDWVVEEMILHPDSPSASRTTGDTFVIAERNHSGRDDKLVVHVCKVVSRVMFYNPETDDGVG